MDIQAMHEVDILQMLKTRSREDKVAKIHILWWSYVAATPAAVVVSSDDEFYKEGKKMLRCLNIKFPDDKIIVDLNMQITPDSYSAL